VFMIGRVMKFLFRKILTVLSKVSILLISPNLLMVILKTIFPISSVSSFGKGTSSHIHPFISKIAPVELLLSHFHGIYFIKKLICFHI